MLINVSSHACPINGDMLKSGFVFILAVIDRGSGMGMYSSKQKNQQPIGHTPSDGAIENQANAQYLVLIVEDDEDTASLYHAILKLHYHNVKVARNGCEAVSTLVEYQGPAAVILDYQLPDMTGIDVMTTCRDLDQPTACMVISANDLSAENASCGEIVRLVKPLGCKALLDWTGKLIEKLQQQLSQSNLNDASPETLLLGESKAMHSLRQQIPLLALSHAPLWLHGESGTGKELVARSIHYCSPRSNEPFIAVNCAAFPESLIESMLFGHIKGAFSGATRDQKGFFEAADGGTLFLDEIGDMPLVFQAKLLRALQTGTILPVGSTKPVTVDCRIVSACHRDLSAAVQQGEFREDLYYRLNVLSIELPPLRERGNDVVLIANRLLSNITSEEHTLPCRLSDSAVSFLTDHAWPGNVRELENTLRRAAILHQGVDLHKQHLISSSISYSSKTAPPKPDIMSFGTINTSGKTLKEIEESVIENTITEHQGCIESAAKSLGVAPSTLYRRRKKTV
ncbi:sigma-54-dependent Fis family transcriptional regulator [Halomonas sp. XH26]|uniref:sigma-54-dependent transcriptional regulator n=1 Tax=Halomonas sp. XH26 TaxID=2557993 RepID=UPI0020A1C38B|nr:sigma-54 dependent transcriptional regulator [Halomonas sp. XH26]UTA80718.1 sigma-54-dependent Fis family transcriptional regulator [Halomonas sp. XH26]